jgi:Ca2+-binding RTX toxin-like protein
MKQYAKTVEKSSLSLFVEGTDWAKAGTNGLLGAVINTIGPLDRADSAQNGEIFSYYSILDADIDPVIRKQLTSGLSSPTGYIINTALTGGNNNDVIRGGAGKDMLTGGKNGDNLYGGYGSDVLTGQGGQDYLISTVRLFGDNVWRDDKERDTLSGGEGKDNYFASPEDKVNENGTDGDRFFYLNSQGDFNEWKPQQQQWNATKARPRFSSLTDPNNFTGNSDDVFIAGEQQIGERLVGGDTINYYPIQQATDGWTVMRFPEGYVVIDNQNNAYYFSPEENKTYAYDA